MTVLEGRGLTVADIEAMPDDGNRHELIDGVLVVSPPPMTSHAIAVSHLLVALSLAAPPEIRVLTAPSAVIIDDHTWVEPDIVVAAKSDFGEKYLERTPLLVVEVLSPGTRLHDLNVKFERYERAGIPSYWVVDPDVPRLIAWERADGRYTKVADVVGAAPWTARLPFDVTVVPAELTD